MGTGPILFLFSVLVVGLLAERQVHVQLLNKCSQTIWPGFKGNIFYPMNGGFELGPAKTADVYMPIGWTGQIWARTVCGKNMTCGTGDCGGKLECNGTGPASPVTVAQLQFNRAGSDYYYIDFLHGHNVPITIRPYGLELAKNCIAAGECSKTMNYECHESLKYWYNGNVEGCMHPCDVYHDEHYCCTGGADNMFECNEQSWPVNYPGWFKTKCPKSLTFKYDWNKTIFSCNGSGNQTNYMIRFC